MNTKKKRFVPKKRLIYRRFLALTLAGTLLLPGLVLIQSQPAEASFIVDMASGVIGKIRYNTTVAELIVSLLTGSGATVTNTQWLSQLDNAYGIESTLATATNTDGTLGAMYEAGLFSIDSAGHFVDQGLGDAIRNTAEYTSLGIDDLFTTTNADLELGAWQAADAATNIGEAAAAGVTLGTIGQVFGAVSLGVHLGVLANKVIDYFGDKMAKAQPITTSDEYMNQIANGQFGFVIHVKTPAGSNQTGWQNVTASSNSCFVGRYNDYIYVLVNPTSARQSYTSYKQLKNGTWSTTNSNVSSKGKSFISTADTVYAVQGNVVDFYTESNLNNFLTNSNGSVPTNYLPYSPDVIGSAGNQRPSNYNSPTSVSNWPNLKPIDDLTDQDKGIQPIPWDEYMDQVQVFNQNTTNNNTTIEQGDIYNEFVTQYITTPSTSETVQTPDYNPTVPEQPNPSEKPENTTEEDIENESYMTTPGLQDVFPFCIPFDIANLFGSFGTIEREAPVIAFPLVSELFGIDEEIVLDLSIFNTVATILRTVELIGFALGLAFVTRYLIGG